MEARPRGAVKRWDLSDSAGGPAKPATRSGRPEATIRDVASAAGVGRQTVSNVLNGHGRVGADARERVLAAIARLDYQPHQAARSLRSRRTRQVAYVMPREQLEPANLILQQYLQALAGAAAQRHYDVLIVRPSRDPRTEIRRLIGSRSVDAFLLSELQPDDPRAVLLAEAGMPFAGFGRTGPALPQCWVDIDNRLATMQAVEHVTATGRRDLAYVGYRTSSTWDVARQAGFLAGVAACGLDADQAKLVLTDHAGARRRIRSLLTSPRPDAIVTSSDRLAAVVYGVAAELRLRVGADLAVTGFDGTVAAGLIQPSLTSVTIPVDEIARRVLDRALRQVGTGPDQLPGQIVPALLRLGDSTGTAGPAGTAGATGPAGAGPWALDAAASPAHAEVALPWKRFHGQPAVPKGGSLPGLRRVTIADVAEAAGVGVGTVSRVMNGSAQVTEPTVQAVRAAADRLGYRRNHAAAALVRGTPRTVAVMVTYLTRPQTVVRLAGALAVLEQQGYDTIVCNVESPAERDRQQADLLRTHRTDGVLAISLPLSRAQAGQFTRAGVALVTVDCAVQGVPHCVVDDVAGGMLGTGHLTGLGHRRIGFIGDEVAAPPAGLGFTSSARRQRGYRQALAAAGLAPDAALIRLGPHSAAAAAELAAELLKSPQPPTAIFAASDTQAIGALAAADRLGVAVPGELSLVGFDDIESASLLGLSTVAQPLARSGSDGARRLCALLRGERVSPLRQELALELVTRTSSGPAPATAGRTEPDRR
jgi:DNA-binding LacI/PurR family transcriptional regulator